MSCGGRLPKEISFGVSVGLGANQGQLTAFMGSGAFMVFLVVELKGGLQLFSVLPALAGFSLAIVLSLGIGDHVWSWGRVLDYFKSSLLGAVVSLGVLLALLSYSTCYARGGAGVAGTEVLGSIGVSLEAGLLSLSFALLIGLLFPCVIIMADFDFSMHRAKYLAYML